MLGDIEKMRWTKKDDEKFRKYYPTADWNFLESEFSGRSRNALQCHARTLGLRRQIRQSLPTDWTEEELQTLRSQFKARPIKELAENLKNRTLKAVQAKAKELGLRKRSGSNWFFKLNLKATDCAYVAGYLDADGSIMISVTRRQTGKLLLSPRVLLISTSPDQIQYLLRLILTPESKGNPYIGEQYSTAGARPCFSIVLLGIKRLPVLLRQLLPYLVLKQEHAKTVLEFCHLRGQRLYHPYSLQELILAEKVKALNGDLRHSEARAALQNLIAEKLSEL